MLLLVAAGTAGTAALVYEHTPRIGHCPPSADPVILAPPGSLLVPHYVTPCPEMEPASQPDDWYFAVVGVDGQTVSVYYLALPCGGGALQRIDTVSSGKSVAIRLFPGGWPGTSGGCAAVAVLYVTTIRLKSPLAGRSLIGHDQLFTREKGVPPVIHLSERSAPASAARSQP
jgi:hypothetical protein